MLTVSDTYRAAVPYSRTFACRVDFYRGSTLVWEQAPVVAGTISADRGQNVRLGCRLTLALAEWEPMPIDEQTCRFKVFLGVSSLGFTETVQLGEYRVDKLDRSAVGAISVDGSGLEAYLVDARFLSPRTPPYGVSTVGVIADLIHEVLPDVEVVPRCTSDRQVTATAVWQRERRDAIDDLANSINAEVYADYQGRFMLVDRPNPAIGYPVYTADEGEGGVIIDRAESSTRDRVYNAASVSGQSTDPDVPPVWAWAADMNPASPTYYYGPFGQKPIFFTSQFFTNVFQCQNYANQLLLEALAENVTVTFDQLPAAFLEVGDVLAVRNPDRSLGQYVLQSFDMPLGTGGPMACKLLSSKIIIADGG